MTNNPQLAGEEAFRATLQARAREQEKRQAAHEYLLKSDAELQEMLGAARHVIGSDPDHDRMVQMLELEIERRAEEKAAEDLA